MKSYRRIFLIVTCSCLFFALGYGSTEKYWKAVETALHDGLPKTAVNNLDTILVIAKKENDYNEWMRALSQKIVIEANIQGNKSEEKVNRLKAEFANADANTKPLLQAILAQWYWHYYDRNRWRFMNRTTTEKMSEVDFTTWDLPKLFKQIDSLYQDILREKNRLIKIQTKRFLGFLEQGSMPPELSPTLYDFIAREALTFYTSAEQAKAQPEDAFEIDANSPAFSSAEPFLTYKPATEDTTSPKYKSLILYQSLMVFHREQKDDEAFVDLDIQRLNYVKNVCYGEERNKIFIQRMTEVIEKNSRFAISSLGAYYLAKAWAEEGDLVKACAIAKNGQEQFPKSIGGRSCGNYIVELNQKSLKLIGENYIPPEGSTIHIDYKNFTKIYFKIYSDSREDLFKQDYFYSYRRDSVLNSLLATQPVAEWETDLPATTDLKEKKIAVDVPKLKPGYYRVLASWQPDFHQSTMVQYASLWVCGITLVARTDNGIVDGLVLDAVSGEPIEGAEVSRFVDKSYSRYEFVDTRETDSNGYFKFNQGEHYRYRFYVKKGTNELFQNGDFYSYREYSDNITERVVFFTDRSLYRPGQIIYFKGICVHVDQEQGIYKVIPDRKVKVCFRDANDQEIAVQTFQTNDFGSFSGQFTAPKDRITGTMSISTSDRRNYTSFRVEEYKRPKFTVELETPKQAVKLNQEIEIKGKATAYTGAPIDDANVRFSVLRTASYPYWWYWFFGRPENQSQSQQIAHGRIKTDIEGNFEITFFAKPDLKISPEVDPTFTYEIHADVTSPDGETRSDDASVRIGYSALMVVLSSGEELCNNKSFPLIIHTRTLDGNALSAKCQIKIYKLKEPATPIRASLQRNYWYDEIVEDTVGEFGENWMKWPKDTIVYETNVSTEISNPDTLLVTLHSGLYKVECLSKDAYDKEVKAFLPLMILPDWDSKKFTMKLPSVVKAKSNSVEVGKNLQAFWGTGYESGRCFVEIERDNEILKRYWTEQNCTQHSFVFPVTEKLRGGFLIHFTQVCENRAYLNTIPIDVPWDDRDLDVTLGTFRDKLVPGEKETMTLRIKGKKNPIASAEMAATMYDFSLDQFYPHHWSRFYFFRNGAYSQRRAIFINGIHLYNTWRDDWNKSYRYPSIGYIHFPSYVIENFFYYRFPFSTKVISGVPYGTYKVIYGRNVEFEGNYGKFKGEVVDAETGEALVGVNVVIEDTSLSTTTDLNGEFVIPKVPLGSYKVKVSYIGYRSIHVSAVESVKGKTTIIYFRLTPQNIQGEEVVVTAQLRGQSEAINQQLASNKIVNIVSEDRIKESPGVSLEAINLKDIAIRKNLNETAFFYPHLLMDKDSTIKIEFTMPEALTKWKFMGFAHGKECENGVVTGYAITKKDLMVQPNTPRFLREGDTIYFTAKVINMSDQQQQGRVQLDFKDFTTEQSMNESLKMVSNVQVFDLKAHSSEAFSWKICVPNGTGPLSYTVVAKSSTFSDGEAGTVPVLSSRIFLTESLPLSIRGPKTKNFVFDRLKDIGESKTLEPFRFTVQMASNPVWYAIQALPYLIEFPYECSEQVFNRYYANSLASHIANSNPRIKEIFNQWRGTDALKSNLEKNQDLKSVMLMETPWVLQAQRESQAKQNIGILFEENTLTSNLNSALLKLKNLQLSNGSWPWFPGGYPSEYITFYITTGFGRLKHLGVETDISLALKALDFLDHWIKSTYESRNRLIENHLTPMVALYLYCRSFYLEERPIPKDAKEAVDYFIRQGEKYWLTLNSRLSQGYLALALHRFGNNLIPKKILASIKERSVQNEEMGMFWREDELSWWWYRAPIETQALMIEAFAEVTKDTVAMEDCKTWLLKQKQTQNWRTTKATSDAVYALILRGTDYLVNTKPVEVKLGKEVVKPEKIEAGTGFYEKVYYKNEIEPQFSNISIKKEDKGIAWGGAHVQYFEEMSKVTSQATNLKLEKKLFVKSDTKKGKVIEPITGSLTVGDIVTVRIILRVDRDMEYVHLKDMRGSGLEPVNVLSMYRYQDGLWYYESTKDAATHFFIDYLPKGTYVFEYDLRVQLKGIYQNGVAEIQCMYAPEFNSHSESQQLEVK